MSTARKKTGLFTVCFAVLLSGLLVPFVQGQPAATNDPPAIDPQTFPLKNVPVFIESTETKRYVFSDGPPIKGNRGAEGGWTAAPKMVGTDSNYYNRALWYLRPTGAYFLIENAETKRYLFSDGPPIKGKRGAEGGWLASSGFASPRVLGTDANYYNRALWILRKSGFDYILENVETKRYLFSDGPPVNRNRGAEGGWLASSGFASPNMVGADANYYNRALFRISDKPGEEVEPPPSARVTLKPKDAFIAAYKSRPEVAQRQANADAATTKALSEMNNVLKQLNSLATVLGQLGTWKSKKVCVDLWAGEVCETVSWFDPSTGSVLKAALANAEAAYNKARDEAIRVGLQILEEALSLFRKQICRLAADALQGRSSPELQVLVKSIALAAPNAGEQVKTRLRASSKALPESAWKPFVNEAARLKPFLNSKLADFKNLFTAANLCDNPGDLQNKLSALALKPLDNFLGSASGDESPHLYVSYSHSGNAAAVLGVSVSISVVTDYKGKNIVVASFGPQIASDVSAAAGIAVHFYPRSTLQDFKGDIDTLDGWNWEIGGGGGEIAVGGISFVFAGDMTKFLGVGASLGAGAGLLPVSLSVAASFSYLLKE